MRNKLFALVAVLATLVAVAALRLGSSQSNTLPDLTLPQLAEPHRETRMSELLGEPGVLNVWASWCVACRSEHPILMDLAVQTDAAVYGINFRDDRDDARRWIEYYGDPYRFSLFDNGGLLGAPLDIDALPVTIVYDATGRITYRHLGPLDQEVVDQVITPLLAAATP